ncbi:MAG: DUF1289 domain-containing protein [Methylophilaceae bacterium]
MDPIAVNSPCIGVCAMSEATGLCLGCYRTIEEIRGWWDMPSTDKLGILEKVAQRQMDAASFDD